MSGAKRLDNLNPKVHETKTRDHRRGSLSCEDVEDLDALEIFDYIRDINDPEHPYTLEQLNVVQEELIKVNQRLIGFDFCSSGRFGGRRDADRRRFVHTHNSTLLVGCADWTLDCDQIATVVGRKRENLRAHHTRNSLNGVGYQSTISGQGASECGAGESERYGHRESLLETYGINFSFRLYVFLAYTFFVANSTARSNSWPPTFGVFWPK
ncbi:FeS-assembly-P domain-containing protein [Aphelenchoides besseyi]|nr:FeS-assembly-P domain-containing protein [Aphelenchoides besseyi]